jgi:hypothetical protein
VNCDCPATAAAPAGSGFGAGSARPASFAAHICLTFIRAMVSKQEV